MGLAPLKIVCSNVTALQTGGSSLLKVAEDAQVVLVQETKCTVTTQKRLSIEYREQGWQVVWGKELPEWRSAEEAKSGGVAILVKEGIPVLTSPPSSTLEKNLWDSTRWVKAKVAYGKGNEWIDVTSVYAPSADPEAREKILGEVMEAAAELGDIPGVIGGDFNAGPGKSGVLAATLDTGWWKDTAEEHARVLGTTPENTYFSVKEGKEIRKRLDYVLLNRAACTGLSSVKVVHDSGLPQHRPVEIALDVGAYRQIVLAYTLPKQFPLEKCGQGVKTAQKAFANKELQWGALQHPQDRWIQWNKWAEDFLLQACEGEIEGPTKAYCGRGRTFDPTPKHRTAKQSKEGDALTVSQRRLTKNVGRLEECRLWYVRSNGGVPPHDVCNCWSKARKELRVLLDDDSLQQDMPSEEALVDLCRAVRVKVSTLADRVKRKRLEDWRQRLRDAWHNAPKAIFKYCKDEQYRKMTALKNEDGKFTANAEEMDTLLHEAWMPILRRYAEKPEPDWGAFREKFAEDIAGKGQAMQMDRLTGKELQQTLGRMKTQTSAGVEGWRMAELKALPLVLLDRLADVFDAIECTGEWPPSLMRALIALIPKGEDDTPLKQRPITITSCVYRLWAAARLRRLIKWQESWIGEQQHGFRAGHSTAHLYWHLSLKLEKAVLSGDDTDQVWGFTIDYAKCFDRVPHEIVLSLAEEWGAHWRILGPLRAAYTAMERRFKLGDVGVGGAFRTTNGILQGCPLSVVLLNALMAVWGSAVTRRTGAIAMGYADDVYAVANTEAEVHGAARVTKEFINAADMEVKAEKCVGFTSKEGTKTKFGLGDGFFPDKKQFGAVGADILAGKGNFGPIARERAVTAHRVFTRVSSVPLSFTEKALIGARGPMMAALHGCEVTDFSKQTIETLRQGAALAVWGQGRKQRTLNIVWHVLSPVGIDAPAEIVQRRMAAFLRLTEDDGMRREAEDVWRLARDRRAEREARRRDRASDLARLRRENPGVANPRVTEMNKKGVIELLWDDLERYGWRWSSFDFWTTHIGLRVHVRLWDKGKWLHELREGIRAHAYRLTVTKRPSMQGIEGGVDRQATNAVWKDRTTDRYLAGVIRGALSGSQLVGVQLLRNKEVETSLCRYCGEAIEDRRHAWWWCPQWDEIRGEDIGKLRVLLKDAPPCFLDFGLVPTIFLQELSVAEREQTVRRVQLMLVNIALARQKYDVEHGFSQKKKKQAVVGQSLFPWGWNLPEGAVLESYNPLENVLWGSKHMKKSPRWTEDHFWALKAWLAALRWPDGTTPPITQLELMLDFEIFSGLDVPGETVLKRAESFGAMMRTAKTMARGRDVWKGVEKREVHHLQELGAGIMTGYTVRPVLTHAAGVEGYLKELKEKATSRRALSRQKEKTKARWGDDADVAHASTPEERSAKNERWKDVKEEQKQAEEVRRRAALAAVAAEQNRRQEARRLQTPAVRVDVRRKVGAMRVCDIHTKMRCGDCEHNNISITACCATHHCDELILGDCVEAREACEVHNFSMCGQCAGAGNVSMKQCCQKHHNCVAHGRGACGACVQAGRKRKKDGLPMLASPQACCGKRHHDTSQGRLGFAPR